MGIAALGLVSTGAVAAASVPTGVPVVAATPCSATARACVDLSAQQAWLLRDGQITRGPVPIHSGGEGRETPPGTFRVEWKNEHHISGESGAPMPWSVFFAPGGIAFHEGDIKTASAGCVRLGADDARAFFVDLQVGDEVQVHN